VSRRIHKGINLVVRELLKVLVALFLTLPFLALVIGALQREGDLVANVMRVWPTEITLENFRAVIGGVRIHPYIPAAVEYVRSAFLNSAIVSLAVTMLAIFFGALSAYSLARLRFRGYRQFSYAILFTRMVPVTMLFIPLYLLLRNLGLLNSNLGIIFCEIGFFLPYVIWILFGFFRSLPSELEDAARIDGCTRLQAFFRIVVPLSTPGLAACGVIIFLISWNELIIPLVLTSKPTAATLPVLLGYFATETVFPFVIIYAAGIYCALPTLILAILLRRYMIRGLTAGALKG